MRGLRRQKMSFQEKIKDVGKCRKQERKEKQSNMADMVSTLLFHSS